MRYFIDTEFIEGFHKPIFGKRRHFIDLISIGIKCEDGREFHAIHDGYDFKKADKWVQDNVIIPLYVQTVHGDARNYFDATNFHKHYGDPAWIIKEDILKFFGCWRDTHFYRAPEGIEVYGYFADYDWVLFASLFGRMIDLPKGFPMYCRDLKQMLDERAEEITQLEMTTYLAGDSDSWQIVGPVSNKAISIEDFTPQMKIEMLKAYKDYPKQTDEHNALADARWNEKLYQFLTPQTTNS